ncbi:hypothetical protein [Hyalangium rubrum]|uniref:Uncharacterized protein n=1 Tax=Hyalangium rubrum TaxID=3103134 RepID=A0ABU5GZN6_9BACT|nr:hypothetical protein [Hyalangium sp. s54d21]MDY7226653.1 hypothetical protein [Hyalangium sp. s54d21]
MRLVTSGVVALCLAGCPGEEPGEGDEDTLIPGTLSGAVTAPNGGTIAGTQVLVCFVVGGRCDTASPNTKSLTLQGTGVSAPYSVANLASGQYLVVAAKDTNTNDELDSGDYEGVYGNGQGAVAVTPPARNINITMAVSSNQTIRGTVTAPANGDVAGTQVTACFISAGQCVSTHANTRKMTVSGSGASASFSFSLPPGQYAVTATKDVNGNSLADSGDYEGAYTTGGVDPTPVIPPMQNLGILLRVKGNTVPLPSNVQYLRPTDFTGGSATVTLQGLSATERVAVIPVHASQSLTVDGLNYTVNTTGVLAQDVSSPEAEAFSPVPLAPLALQARTGMRAHQEAHLAKMEKDLRDVRALRQAGAATLGAPGTVSSLAIDNCAGPYTVDTKTCRFWIDTSTGQTQITATLKRVSTNAYWFVQNEDLSDFSSAELQSLANDFETRVVPPDRQYFGNFADVDGNQKILIVFSRLLAPQGLLGYVKPLDLFDDAVAFPETGVHSNEGDIFYAATPGSFGGQIPRTSYFSVVMPATMVHELKHLIATGRRLTSDQFPEELWIEEGSAMAAQQLAGLGSQVDEIQGYAEPCLSSPQSVRVVYESRPSGALEGQCIYGYNFLLVWRAAQKKGHANFWKNWVMGPGSGIANLEAHTGTPFSELMMDWAATLALDHANYATGYDYDSFNLRDGSWGRLGAVGLQSGTSGRARSMSYLVGRGTGGNANITINVTNGAAPHVVILRLPGVLP